MDTHDVKLEKYKVQQVTLKEKLKFTQKELELIEATQGHTIECRVEKFLEYLTDYKNRMQEIKDKAVADNKELLEIRNKLENEYRTYQKDAILKATKDQEMKQLEQKKAVNLKFYCFNFQDFIAKQMGAGSDTD